MGQIDLTCLRMDWGCRLCGEPSVEGSIFCAAHRSQASVFSQVFAPPAEAREAEVPTPASRSPARTPQLAQEDPAASEKVAGLAEILLASLASLGEREAEARSGRQERCPQISVYMLGGRLLGRIYYSVVPKACQQPEEPVLSLRSEVVRQACSPRGVVFQEFVRVLAEQIEKLELSEIQTLDLIFLTYAGVIAINLHLPSQQDVNVCNFQWDAGEFVARSLSEVEQLIGHHRWQCWSPTSCADP